MFYITSLFISLGALCTHAQLVKDLITNQNLSFKTYENNYGYMVSYYKSGDSIDILCKSNAAKEILIYWYIYGKKLVRCDKGSYEPIRYRSQLREIDHNNYLACMSMDKSNSFTRKIYFSAEKSKILKLFDMETDIVSTISDKTVANETCQYMSEMLCPVSSTVESIAVAVNGKKLTTLSHNYITIYEYLYYYNSSDSLQINCSVVNGTVNYLSICGDIMDSNEFINCTRGDACTVTKTIRLGPEHKEIVLYCYTLLSNKATQSVARLTLSYKESKTVSSDITDTNYSSNYGSVIPLPTKKSNNKEGRIHETGVVNTTTDAASDSGPVIYGIYALTVSSVILIIATACVVCAYKKRGNVRGPDEVAQDRSASERVVENELYIRSEPSAEYATPFAQAQPAEGDTSNKEQEAACTYANVDTVNQYSDPVGSMYMNSAVNTRKDLT